jgi:hypothetical protein
MYPLRIEERDPHTDAVPIYLYNRAAGRQPFPLTDPFRKKVRLFSKRIAVKTVDFLGYYIIKDLRC